MPIQYRNYFIMSVRQFSIQLVLVTVFVCAVLLLLSIFPAFYAHRQMSFLSLVMFFFISIVMFFTGRWGTSHENKSTFIGLMYLYMGGKMILSVLMILLYYLYIEPETKLFILPFFVVYFIYTIFESYFLMKLSDTN